MIRERVHWQNLLFGGLVMAAAASAGVSLPRESPIGPCGLIVRLKRFWHNVRAGRVERLGRRPRGDLPGLAGAGDDLHLRRPGRPKFRLHPSRVYRGGASQSALQQLRRRRPALALARGWPVQPLVQTGRRQNLNNWFTPPALNEGTFEVNSHSDWRCIMTRLMKFSNASGTAFELLAHRLVRLLHPPI